MRQVIIILTLLGMSCAFVQAQTREQRQEVLAQFLTADLLLTPDQTSAVRGFIRQADAQMAKHEVQYFGKPDMVAHLREAVIVELGKSVETILTPAQRQQYPLTKQKLFNSLQKRYEDEMAQLQGSAAETYEMQEATTREVINK